MPSFPSSCNVWHNPAAFPPPGPPDLFHQACALQQVRAMWGTGAVAVSYIPNRYINFPPRTDIEISNPNGPDVIELPAGGGYFYQVIDVQDVYRDTADEFRRVLCVPVIIPTVIP